MSEQERDKIPSVGQCMRGHLEMSWRGSKLRALPNLFYSATKALRWHENREGIRNAISRLLRPTRFQLRTAKYSDDFKQDTFFQTILLSIQQAKRLGTREKKSLIFFKSKRVFVKKLTNFVFFLNKTHGTKSFFMFFKRSNKQRFFKIYFIFLCL